MNPEEYEKKHRSIHESFAGVCPNQFSEACREADLFAQGNLAGALASYWDGTAIAQS